jgi:hypothetical protein
VRTLLKYLNHLSLGKLVRVNVRSTFICYREAANQMIKQGKGGSIIGEETKCLAAEHLSNVCQARARSLEREVN